MSVDNRPKKREFLIEKYHFSEFYTGDESRNFMLEILAMKNLGHHPYIVSIIGSCMTGPKLCLVMDYCALGDLRNYLRKYREKVRTIILFLLSDLFFIPFHLSV